MSDERTARLVTVHGDVQGVFFRDSTRREAVRHGVTGWVRNTPEGTVEAWLEAGSDSVEAVVAWMRQGGPERAWVRDVSVDERAPEGHETFQIR